MKVTVKKFSVDWLEIKNACRQTVSMGDSNAKPTTEWKRKLLVSRHSPLRLGEILVQIEDIPFYVMGHLVRHSIGCTPFVATSRSDRTGVDREERKQTDLLSMQMVFNIESLLNISEKRLCHCADAQTLKAWKAVLEAVKAYDNDIYWACVPTGISRGGCTEEFANCQMCNNILKEMSQEDMMIPSCRYDAYRQKIKKDLH